MARAERRVIGVDTNIALRLILQDDRVQLASIEQLIADHQLFLPLTVIMETGWVLASRYQMPRDDIADAVVALMTLANIEVARAELVGWAIRQFRAGADWADALHLVASSKLSAFATLDRKLARRAGTDSPVPIETLA